MALSRRRYKLTDAVSRVIRAATELFDLCGEVIKARNGRDDRHIIGGHREGSMRGLSMEGASFKRPILVLRNNFLSYSLVKSGSQ